MTRERTRNKFQALAAGCLLLSAPTLQAAIKTESGNGFMLRWDDSIESVFGIPQIVGATNDVIRFNPGNLTPAERDASLRASDGNDTFATVSFDIIPSGNTMVTGLSLFERGDYRITDVDPNDTPSSVDLGGSLRLVSSEFGLEEWTDSIAANAPFLTDTGGTNLEWTASASIAAGAMDSLLGTIWEGTPAGTDPFGNEIFLTVSIQNNLFTTLGSVGNPADDVFIEKKLLASPIELQIFTPVPLPAGIWLLGSSLAMLFGFRRLQRKS